ncbi:MAG: pyrimidine utilization protein D [Phenylobacterium sp.]|uniref:pyrimidine utilization protein D n=1 Tax=Phenylobacterium sp. TaxID=1871053 RepID=UPI00273597E8|nr:pyrimidine utilization protein D [Phenylobacterium sp.]MDP3747084.1 pyrimidine utilization protein D [Phenylobacterium sp.]
MAIAEGIFYEVHEGPAGAASVVLSAGLGGSGAFWGPQMAALSQRFTVVLYDHRGTGRSVRELTAPHSVDAMADDIVAVLDAVGLERAHLVGHAAGGLAGLALALRYPQRLDRLVVVNGWAAPDPHIARCFATRVSLLNDSGVEAYVRAQPLFLYPPDWISANDARLEAEAVHHVAGFPTKDVMLARIGALLAFDISGRLGEISAPVLVSASADDMLVPPSCSRRLAQGLAHATLEVVPWGGHGFTVTAAQAFNASVVAFLS